MHTLNASFKTANYPVYVGTGLIKGQALLAEALHGAKVFVISDTQIWPLFADLIQAACQNSTLHTYCIAPGETSKSLSTLESIASYMATHGFGRDTLILAVGGGVVTDLAGFLASIYMRGVGYINIPTTYLAQIDAAIGGKTAVNLAQGKNLLGSFHAPQMVINDTDCLQTLPDRELRAGLAELVKIAVIADQTVWHWLEQAWPAILAKDPAALAHSVYQACRLKQNIVALDPLDNSQRMLLNFGHTVGHVLETLGGYSGLLHGEAVALGMLLELEYAYSRGLVSQAVYTAIATMLHHLDLIVSVPKLNTNLEAVQTILSTDKKRSADQLHIAIPTVLGCGRIIDVEHELALAQLIVKACAGKL